MPAFTHIFSPFHAVTIAGAAARHYDSGLSLWLSVDPMADKYPGVSPYVYCGDNPVALKDPDGRTIYDIYGERKRIADGHDNVTVDNVTFNQFDKLQKAFNRHHLHRYERLRNRYKTHNGYTVIETLIQASPDKDGFNTAPLVHSTHHDGKPYLGEKISAFFRRIDEGGSGDYFDRKCAEVVEPYATAAVSMMRGISQINDVMTIHGEDMFGNPATTYNKVGAGVSLITVGTSKIPIKAVQLVSKWISRVTKIYTAGNTWNNERKKIER